MYDVKKQFTVIAHNISNIKSQSPRTDTVTFAIKINLESKSQLKCIESITKE